MITRDELGLISKQGLKYKYSDVPNATIFPDQTTLITCRTSTRPASSPNGMVRGDVHDIAPLRNPHPYVTVADPAGQGFERMAQARAVDASPRDRLEQGAMCMTNDVSTVAAEKAVLAILECGALMRTAIHEGADLIAASNDEESVRTGAVRIETARAKPRQFVESA